MNEQNRKTIDPRGTPAFFRLEALEAAVLDLEQSYARRLAAIETFLWAEAGYNPAYRGEGAVETDDPTHVPPNTTPTWDELCRSYDAGRRSASETVTPEGKPKQKGRAGEGVRELSREEQVAILYPDGHAGQGRAAIQSREVAHAAAVRLHAYCNRNGYEGIGHSIGLLVAELERQV